MTTITGKTESSAGETLYTKLAFESQSTPQFRAGVVELDTVKRIESDPNTGEFELQLAAGNYRVTAVAKGITTTYTIAVPEGNDTFSIEDLVSSVVAEIPGAPPNVLWNGMRAGHITFDPISNPAAPPLSIVDYTGGNLASETHYYKVTHVTQEGETALSAEATITGAGAANKAVRITLAVSPTRVITKRIWRRFAPSGTDWWLIAEVAPAVASYDDWMSEANFVDVFDTLAPFPAGDLFNTTAGIIRSSSGVEALYFSSTGLRALVGMQFDALATLHGAAFITGHHSTYVDAALVVDNHVAEQDVVGISVREADGQTVNIFEACDRDSTPLFSVGRGNWDGDANTTITAADHLQAKFGFRLGVVATTAGYVMTADANGYATWQTLPSATGTNWLATPGTDPNGSVTGSPGHIATDAAGALWIKSSGINTNTGWENRL